MKTLRSLLVAAAVFVGSNLFAQNIINANEVNVTINAETSREQLFQLRNELLAQGLDFQYTPQFDMSRKLVSIAFSIRTVSGGNVVLERSTPQAVATAPVGFHLTKQNGSFAPAK
jgi:hypothetical protein